MHGFFSTCHALITWFELSRVKLYRNELKENKSYFKLAGASSYRGKNYIKYKKEIRGKSTLVRVSEGSSYRESTVECNFIKLHASGMTY